jgi:two-component system, chemotaxis family, protein-glutamate methylesterase/glutaminase
MALRVLVVDDTITYRKIISDVLQEIPGIEVVGTANNGKTALARIQSLHPDLITLDIEMPEMNGLEVLEAIRTQGIKLGVVMVSAFTRRGSELTIRALELGAFDFITKSEEGTAEQNRQRIKNSLAPLLKAYSQRLEIRSILKGAPPPPATTLPTKPPVAQPVEPARVDLSDLSQRMHRVSGKFRPEMILIGISTGGPNALSVLIPKLPANLGVPVLLVQHMPPMFTRTLAESLDKQSALKVKEAEDAEGVMPNTVYIAPGGKHMKVASNSNGKTVIQISDEPPENNCKPSVDTLFRSAAYNFPGRTCAVIMTGMGNDGTLGLRLIKRHPSWVIAQNEASCVVFGMPKEAIAAGIVDLISPLDGIAEEICKAVQGF